MIIKRATEAGEFFQIHQLNYKTFVEEIPQHQQNTEKILVDKFHNKNQYIVAKRNDKLIGMVCYNLQRPFSLDEKISNLNNYLPEFTNLAEIRLLSVIPEERNTKVVYRLFKYVATEEFEIEGIRCVMTPAHAIYLIGMEIDFQGGLNSRGFTFTNPNASKTCGCGTSLAV